MRLVGCVALVLAVGVATHVAAPVGARAQAEGYAENVASRPRAVTAPDDTLHALVDGADDAAVHEAARPAAWASTSGRATRSPSTPGG